MTEKKNEEIAVFRFGVIHEFVGGAALTQNGVETKAPMRKPAKIGIDAFSSNPNKLSTTYGTEAVIDCTNVR